MEIALVFTYCKLNQKNVYTQKRREEKFVIAVSFLLIASLNLAE